MDEKNAADEKEAVLEVKRVEQLNAAKSERERKKQEAIERSKARQKDPAYFQQIAETNTKPEMKSLEGLEEISVSTEVGDDDNAASSADPFLDVPSKSRGKIHFNF